MNYNVMNYNYEAVQVMMHGVDLLCSMLHELTENVKTLPNCGKTANVKRFSANVHDDCMVVYEMLQNVCDEVEEVNENVMYSEGDFCTENLCDDEYDDEARHHKLPHNVSEMDIETINDMIDELFADGKITVSADIYINKDKDNSGNKDSKDNDAESEDK